MSIERKMVLANTWRGICYLIDRIQTCLSAIRRREAPAQDLTKGLRVLAVIDLRPGIPRLTHTVDLRLRYLRVCNE